MKEMVAEAITLLQGNGPLADFGRLLHENWKYKRTLSSKVTTPEVDSIFDIALANGAVGGKTVGSWWWWFCNTFRAAGTAAPIRKSSAIWLGSHFALRNSGSRIVLYQPDGL